MPIMWKMDPDHTEIQFNVKHLMISTVTGYFKKFEGHAITETDDFNSATEIEFRADVDSIDTNSVKRDTHLKSPEFFDAAKYGQVIFTGTRYDALGEEATLQGNLTIRGIMKPITLNVEYSGTVIDPLGQTKAGFTVTGKLSRKQYGLVWNGITEAGQVVAGDEIKIHAEVEFIKQQSSTADKHAKVIEHAH